MRIALAQLNPVVGDVAGNLAMVLDAMDQARGQGAAVLVTSELVLIGYPPRDLLLREGVVPACERAVEHIAAAAGDLTVLVGYPRCVEGRCHAIANSVAICRAGAIEAVYDKRLLPGYDVFDEDRYFEPGHSPLVFETAGTRLGVLVCEDIWRAEDIELERRYTINPVTETLNHRPDVLVALNASPFVLGKGQRHVEMLSAVARQTRLPIVSVNQVGGNDDLIFDGRSVVVNKSGDVVHALPGWSEAVSVFDLDGQAAAVVDTSTTWQEELYHALVLGMRDYVIKSGNERVLIGLSGGIDSALTATLAAAALGGGSITGVIMTSRYTAPHSIEDARTLITNLGIGDTLHMPIKHPHETMRQAFEQATGRAPAGVTDENIQARLRGVLLMATSNAAGGLVLVTSNKSELAMGYTTLYGDMAGAVAPLADVTKTRVYELARWINANHAQLGFDMPPIPERSITRPPSAELRADQTDQDTLPPYDVLDEIVTRRIDREQSAERIIEETGFDAELVRQVLLTIDREQYKRDQAAVVLKVTPRAFGRGRPMPIVMNWSAVGAVDRSSTSMRRLTVPQGDASAPRQRE